MNRHLSQFQRMYRDKCLFLVLTFVFVSCSKDSNDKLVNTRVKSSSVSSDKTVNVGQNNQGQEPSETKSKEPTLLETLVDKNTAHYFLLDIVSPEYTIQSRKTGDPIQSQFKLSDLRKGDKLIYEHYISNFGSEFPSTIATMAFSNKSNELTRITKTLNQDDYSNFLYLTGNYNVTSDGEALFQNSMTLTPKSTIPQVDETLLKQEYRFLIFREMKLADIIDGNITEGYYFKKLLRSEAVETEEINSVTQKKIYTTSDDLEKDDLLNYNYMVRFDRVENTDGTTCETPTAKITLALGEVEQGTATETSTGTATGTFTGTITETSTGTSTGTSTSTSDITLKEDVKSEFILKSGVYRVEKTNKMQIYIGMNASSPNCRFKVLNGYGSLQVQVFKPIKKLIEGDQAWYAYKLDDAITTTVKEIEIKTHDTAPESQVALEYKNLLIEQNDVVILAAINQISTINMEVETKVSMQINTVDSWWLSNIYSSELSLDNNISNSYMMGSLFSNVSQERTLDVKMRGFNRLIKPFVVDRSELMMYHYKPLVPLSTKATQ